MSGLTKDQIRDIESKTNDLIASAYGSSRIKPPIDLAEILKKNGIKLKFGKFEDPSIAGFYKKSEKTIYVSEDDSYSRQTFTIAHELGHFLLHEDKTSDVFYRLDSIQLDKQDKAEEQEANWFASSLIMPENLMRDYWDIIPDEREMRRIFKVSQSAMNWRLKNLELID